jgi:hypothetical protein
MSVMKRRGTILSSELEEDIGAAYAFEKGGERRRGKVGEREG